MLVVEGLNIMRAGYLCCIYIWGGKIFLNSITMIGLVSVL